ncbi:ATP-binding protein [Horticoccus sp. 23ND18S-11]|uniref:ATP-binding protein n=1 Tax=Horticoccus sp. 23ND18S-11 TaxID=3391832 RepID=UPI0039C9A88B
MLRTRLYLGLLPLLLLIAATGGYAIYVCRDLAGSLSRDLVNNYRSVVAAQQMRTAATLMNSALAPLALGENERRVFEENKSTFTRELMAQAALSAGSPRSRFVGAVDEEFARFRQRGEALLQVGGSGSLRAAIDNRGSIVSIYGALDRLAQHDVEAAQQTAARVDRLGEKTQQVMLVTIAGGVVLFLFLAWRLAASLLAPIRMLTASAVALGDGDLDREVPELSRDELGQLAKAFNTMAIKLRSYRNATVARVLRAQRTMEATLTSAPDPLFVVGRDGTVEVRNPAAEQLASLPEFAHGFPPELAEALERVLASGEHDVPTDYSRAIALRVAREDRHYLPRVLAIGDKLTEFNGAAIILQDVTKFRLMDDAKTNLVGTVSHELKTPLTSLRMALYLLLEQKLEGLSGQQRELLEDARTDADRLLRILDTLLDLTRLEGGASTLERSEVPVATLVRNIANEAQAFIGNVGQRLTVTIAPELSAVALSVDEDRIRHVFMNLLTNASKFSPAGGAIALRADAEEGGFVRFSVRDEGPGIPSASIGRIFERFYRAPHQDKRPGAGLGLAIAREIVVAHGGSIACTSVEGHGSEFYFVLPR